MRSGTGATTANYTVMTMTNNDDNKNPTKLIPLPPQRRRRLVSFFTKGTATTPTPNADIDDITDATSKPTSTSPNSSFKTLNSDDQSTCCSTCRTSSTHLVTLSQTSLFATISCDIGMKSILKATNSATATTSTRTKKTVRFQTRAILATIHHVSLVPEDERDDVWYSMEELEVYNRMQKEVATLQEIYLDFVHRGRKHIQKKPTLPTESYNQIKIGRDNGYAGLEQYSKKFDDIRADDKKVSALVVARYKKLSKQRQNLHNTTSSNRRSLMDDEKVAAYSRSLSNGCRNWALVLGQMDHEVA